MTSGKAVSEKRRSAVRYDPSPVHYNCPVGYREKLLKAVLGGYDGHAEIAVQPAHGVDEVLCGYRVELRRWLVQKQQLRVEHRRRSQAEELLLTAGKRVGRLVEKLLKSEVPRHFADPAAYFVPLHSHALAGKRQFVPHLVGDGLSLGILHYKSDFRGGVPVRLAGQLSAEEPHVSGKLPARKKPRLHQPKQR